MDLFLQHLISLHLTSSFLLHLSHIYIHTEAFNASFQPLLRYGAPLEKFSPIIYSSHEGVIPLRDRELPLIQQELDDDRDTFYDEESNMHFCYYLGDNPPESDEQAKDFAKTH